MKNLFIVAIAFIGISLSSCQKGAKVVPSLKNSFTATIDGKSEDFTFNDTVRTVGTNGLYISGMNQATKDHIMLYAGASGETFTAGTYVTEGPGGAGTAQLFYRDGSISLGANGYGGYYFTYNNYLGVDYSGSVTYTTVSDSLVKGTFSGLVVSENSVVGATGLEAKNVTDGKFTIYIRQQP